MAHLGYYDLCERARSAVAEGDLSAARRHFEQALELDPDSVEAHYGIGTVCHLLKDVTAAIDHFEEVRRIDPTHAGAAINLGALCIAQGRYQEAVQHLQRGIRLDPKRSEGYYNLGIAYRKMGNDELAIQAYREAHHLNPRMAEACYNLANTYFDLQRYDQAEVYYRRCIQINPGFRKAREALDRTRQILEKQRRPGDSQIVVSGPIKDPYENDPRLDRALDPEHDLDTLNRFHTKTVDTTKTGESWIQRNEQLDNAVRNLAIGLSADPSSEEFRESVRKFRAAVNDFRKTMTAFGQLCQELGETREKMVART